MSSAGPHENATWRTLMRSDFSNHRNPPARSHVYALCFRFLGFLKGREKFSFQIQIFQTDLNQSTVKHRDLEELFLSLQVHRLRYLQYEVFHYFYFINPSLSFSFFFLLIFYNFFSP